MRSSTLTLESQAKLAWARDSCRAGPYVHPVTSWEASGWAPPGQNRTCDVVSPAGIPGTPLSQDTRAPFPLTGYTGLLQFSLECGQECLDHRKAFHISEQYADNKASAQPVKSDESGGLCSLHRRFTSHWQWAHPGAGVKGRRGVGPSSCPHEVYSLEKGTEVETPQCVFINPF